MPKDRFSLQSDAYAKYRPLYPPALYQLLLQHVDHRELAWDCATGNGQVARVLSDYFDRVKATDISEQQLSHAEEKQNIEYLTSDAEKTPFEDQIFDLITVGQALHWFEMTDFYREVDRVLKRGGLFAVWGYGMIRFRDKLLNDVVDWFYEDITGPYWDFERSHVDGGYKEINFPYPVIPAPDFKIEVAYDAGDLLNFFSSWSSAKNYQIQKHRDPVPLVADRLKGTLIAEKKVKAWFPGFIFMGRKP